MTNHQSKPNNITMHQLIIVILLVSSVICLPSNQQQRTTDYDKQLLRKALDETNLSKSDLSTTINTSVINFQCPEQFGYYTDTRDCTKYYVCVFGEVLHESCTGGLRFSRELQTCDWPRNVDCPHANSVNGSAATQTGGVSSSSPFVTTIATSTTSSELIKQHSTAVRETPSDEDEERTLKGGSSMVFADEGSDPQQPSFDEAVSPVITADGAIHLHDGSGGTFSLTPNHNRPIMQNKPPQQQPQDGHAVDVFVKPLLTQQSNNRPRNQQNQVLSNRQATSSKLQPATLHDQRDGQHRNLGVQQTSNQHHLHHNNRHHTAMQQIPQTTTLHSVNHLSQNVNTNSNEQPEESDDEPENDSIGVQADQESNESQDSSGASGGGNSGQHSPASGYIPPVIAPNTQRQLGASRQSSQLLSINNRQVDSRQSFKPILVTSSLPITSTTSQQLQANNDKFSNQRSQATFVRPTNINNNDNEDQYQDLQEEVRPNVRLNSQQQQQRQNQTLQHQHQMHVFAQQQNNRQSRMSNNFQQFSPNDAPSTTANIGNNRQQSRFLPLDQTMSNNVNFNDSSKLIRLQASQFEPMPSDSSNSLNPKFPSSSSARSQNVLFSQHPFGLIADINNNANTVSDHNEAAGISQQDGTRNTDNETPNINRNFNSVSPNLQQQRRPRPPKREQIPSNPVRRPNQLIASNQPIDIDTTTIPTTTSQPTTNSFMSTHETSFIDQEEPVGQPTLPTRAQMLSSQATRPTTVNFQQQEGLTTSFGHQTAFATTPPTATTTGARRYTEAQVNRNLQSSNQGQRSAQLLAQTESPLGLITSKANSNTNLNSNPTANQEQDPQLVANRYLNSAIDALEAGQPFGTVDYDFDILNDNSTDRRNPTSSAGVIKPTSQLNNQTSFNLNLNSNRQRQQQPAFSQDDDDGENISLTNGQPNGSQIGLNLRPQQQVSQPVSVSRVKAGGQQPQQANNRQPSAGGQFNQDSLAPNLPQITAPSSLSTNQQQNLPTTKKPRPTNKKINVNHEQAIANNRASTEPARRPEALFSTPNALQTATKCDNRNCRLPDCKCGDTLIPGGLDPKVIPQVILLTFDDAVNDLNWEIYEELFTGKTNPNGCPVLATFYVSHEWTDYGQVQTLYSRGHEMASHSITHSFGEKFSKSQWFKEVNGQREILNMYGGVKMNDVRGMRAPFLQVGGNKMFEMLYDANFTYDSSMPIFENSPPLWPYTLDYQMTHECMITPCPTKSYPGVWEVGMTMWVDLRGGRCSMGDACSNPPDEDGVYEMLMKNFNRHYKSNRAPFGLFYHSAWFNTVHHRRGFLRFMGTVNSLSDVFFVTNWQMLQWMRKPTPVSEINTFEPWQCPAKNDRPPPCFHPSVCNVKSEHGTRFMKTCQPCPVNQQYPWVGSTGFKGKQAGSGGGSG